MSIARKYAVIGSPVAHSLSPRMQNAAFAALKMKAAYFALEINRSNLSSVLAELPAQGFYGLNVTAPLKEAVVPYLCTISSIAQQLKAVNTIVISRDGKLHGHNTDVDGFCQDLVEKGIFVAEQNVVVLGTGGAARAVIYALLKSRCRTLLLLGRTQEKALSLANYFKTIFSDCQISASAATECAVQYPVFLAVNCTGDSERCLDLVKLCRPFYLYDLCYSAIENRAAQLLPAKYSDGLGMLLYQGALSFTLWTGNAAPLEHMKSALGK